MPVRLIVQFYTYNRVGCRHTNIMPPGSRLAAMVGASRLNAINRFIRDHRHSTSPFVISLPITKYEEFDKRFRIRNIFMAVNTIVSIALMIATLQEDILDFDDKDTSEFVTKCVITFFTVIQIILILDYYYQHVLLVYEETCHSISYKSKIKALARHDRLNPYDSDINAFKTRPSNEENASLLKAGKRLHTAELKVSYWAIFRTSNMTSRLVGEILLTLPHCLPLPFDWTTKLGLFMFFRLYIILRVVRDFSPRLVFETQLEHFFSLQDLVQSASNSSVAEFNDIGEFDVWILDADHPEGTEFNIYTSVLLSAQVLVSGWATDTWDVYNPSTPAGKVVTLSSTVFGLFMVAMLLEYMHNRMQLSDWERTIMRAINYSNDRHNEQEQAAKLIQIAWRYSRSREAEQEGAINHYTFALLKQLKIWRKIRKERQRREIVDGTARDNEVYDLRQYIDESVNDMRVSLIKDIAIMFRQQRRSRRHRKGKKMRASQVHTSSESEMTEEENGRDTRDEPLGKKENE
ncbi:hypothetical protein PROFUN_06128 [Planoprotostelium fungivorum]|uniref:Uncharacterized protein n=1 Tax=Planoprotostelium fungivorum TaxID=1890364 RepID=A0A2P6NPH2_9EUKA|nr:hypothetical protein PROFUN_06128 [Planoprotostelium fungivorum]